MNYGDYKGSKFAQNGIKTLTVGSFFAGVDMSTPAKKTLAQAY